jgi:hypothetical protein
MFRTYKFDSSSFLAISTSRSDHVQEYATKEEGSVDIGGVYSDVRRIARILTQMRSTVHSGGWLLHDLRIPKGHQME